MQKEIRLALDVADEKPEGTIFLIPLRLEQCDVPSRLSRWHWVDLFQPGGYEKLLVALRRRMAAIQAGTVAQNFAQTQVTAAPLPINYVERTKDLASIREAVLQKDGRPEVALTALRGMGGIGKSMLARALCHDEKVQKAFPDGVFWVDIGQQNHEI